MAKYGSSVVTVTITDAPGGTNRIITPYVNSIGGYKKESITEQSNPFGTAFVTNTPVGVSSVADIEIEGIFDDTASVGPKAVFGLAASWALDIAPASVGRTLIILAATGATFTVTVHLKSYEVMNKVGALTRYKAVVCQASDGVWS